MIIENEEQLDYCDVLFKPKRTTLNSRSEPNIYKTYKFKWTGKEIEANGLMVANMATTGTLAMAKVMQYNKMFCCLHKHYSYEVLKEFLEFNNFNAKTFDGKMCGNDYVFVSTGIKQGDYEKICKILDLGLCKNLCIDIANGYIPNLLKFVRTIREQYPDLIIMVGNVVTGDIVQDLILSGADIVKVGIGSGCFTGDMKVLTENGLVKIKDIQEGDKVLTHTGKFQKVSFKYEYTHHKGMVSINNIKCTLNHHFLVIDKSNKEKVNKDNFLNYSMWVEAELLNDQYCLIKLPEFELIDIDNIEYIENDKKTYDLEVDNDHSYNIEGIIVHNSNCTTRKMTGVGRPQISANIECSDASHGVGGMICADGGITCYGDIAKAFGTGADFVMCGGLFAGTDEAEGEIIEKCFRTNEYSTIDELDGDNVIIKPDSPQYKMNCYKLAYGMSSSYAQEKHWNGMAKYRASEGIKTLKPYVGSCQSVIDEYTGSLRSTMTYIGANRLKDIPKCATFYKVRRILNNDGKGIE